MRQDVGGRAELPDLAGVEVLQASGGGVLPEPEGRRGRQDGSEA